MGSFILEGERGLFRYSQVSWQHLGEKAVQLPMESFGKAMVEGQGPGQEGGARTGFRASLETGVSIRKGADTRSLDMGAQTQNHCWGQNKELGVRAFRQGQRGGVGWSGCRVFGNQVKGFVSFSDLLTPAKVAPGFLLQPRLACCIICVSTRVLLAMSQTTLK